MKFILEASLDNGISWISTIHPHKVGGIEPLYQLRDEAQPPRVGDVHRIERPNEAQIAMCRPEGGRIVVELEEVAEWMKHDGAAEAHEPQL